LFANLGIAQLEKSLSENSCNKIFDMLELLAVDGLVVHINPLQEFLQKEGDIIKRPPIETIQNFLELTKTKVIVKEVGQGMGPKSLQALLKLPIAGIELAGFGGTNFSQIELMRKSDPHRGQGLSPLSSVGHSALEMIEILNGFAVSSPMDIIISGGINNFLDGYYLLKKSLNNAVIGQAKNFLVHAENYEQLKAFIQNEILGLKMANAFLTLKDGNKK
jgi:isopentenyl-diphosphate delta-isomerase